QLDIERLKQKSLEITSPIDGKVVTWKVRENIENRPVNTGARLMEIADATKDWELEIDVPESKLGHIEEYRQKLLASDPHAHLEVTFILFTHPDTDLHGRVTRMDP